MLGDLTDTWDYPDHGIDILIDVYKNDPEHAVDRALLMQERIRRRAQKENAMIDPNDHATIMSPDDVARHDALMAEADRLASLIPPMTEQEARAEVQRLRDVEAAQRRAQRDRQYPTDYLVALIDSYSSHRASTSTYESLRLEELTAELERRSVFDHNRKAVEDAANGETIQQGVARIRDEKENLKFVPATLAHRLPDRILTDGEQNVVDAIQNKKFSAPLAAMPDQFLDRPPLPRPWYPPTLRIDASFPPIAQGTITTGHIDDGSVYGRDLVISAGETVERNLTRPNRFPMDVDYRELVGDIAFVDPQAWTKDTPRAGGQNESVGEAITKMKAAETSERNPIHPESTDSSSLHNAPMPPTTPHAPLNSDVTALTTSELVWAARHYTRKSNTFDDPARAAVFSSYVDDCMEELFYRIESETPGGDNRVLIEESQDTFVHFVPEYTIVDWFRDRYDTFVSKITRR